MHPSSFLGVHVSIAGGIHKSVERANSIGCNTMQIFVKNNNQWVGKQITDCEIRKFKELREKLGIKPIVAHDTYLINLCANNKYVLEKSRLALKDELDRCESLGIEYLNFHPGSHMGQGESVGIKLIAESINIIHQQTPNYKVKSVLETTSGQGTSIGYKFEQLRAIIDLIENKDRIAVCIDTCHIFASGYNISTEIGWEKTFNEFDDIIGLGRLVAIHVNDSKREYGSRIDRHEHIGKGKIGLTGFRLLMNDVRFTNIPKILETPKGKDMKEDIQNMKRLKKLILF